MTYYYAQIEWSEGAEEKFINSKIKYAPVIKSSVFNGADTPCWVINLESRSHKMGKNYIDFHFISPDVPDIFTAGDAFTLWQDSDFLAKGTVVSKYKK